VVERTGPVRRESVGGDGELYHELARCPGMDQVHQGIGSRLLDATGAALHHVLAGQPVDDRPTAAGLLHREAAQPRVDAGLVTRPPPEAACCAGSRGLGSHQLGVHGTEHTSHPTTQHRRWLGAQRVLELRHHLTTDPRGSVAQLLGHDPRAVAVQAAGCHRVVDCRHLGHDVDGHRQATARRRVAQAELVTDQGGCIESLVPQPAVLLDHGAVLEPDVLHRGEVGHRQDLQRCGPVDHRLALLHQGDQLRDRPRAAVHPQPSQLPAQRFCDRP
jgi:hypothetical protein